MQRTKCCVALMVVCYTFILATAWNAEAAPSPAQVIPLAMYRTGIQPSQLSASSGRTVIVIFNHTGLTNAVVRITRQPSPSAAVEKVQDTNISRHTRKSIQELQLLPGTYTISVIGEPALQSTITVPPGK